MSSEHIEDFSFGDLKLTFLKLAIKPGNLIVCSAKFPDECHDIFYNERNINIMLSKLGNSLNNMLKELDMGDVKILLTDHNFDIENISEEKLDKLGLMRKPIKNT